MEPAGTAQQLLDGALGADIPAAGLQIDDQRRVAGGRAQILIVSPPGG